MQYSFAMNDMLHTADSEKWSVSDQIDLLEFGLKILKRDLIYDRLCEAYFSVSENNNRDFRKELGKFVRDYETADGTINPAKPEQKRMVLVRLNDVYTDPWQRKKLQKAIRHIHHNGLRTDHNYTAGYYLTGMEIGFICDGIHHVAASMFDPNARIMLYEANLEKLYPYIDMDDNRCMVDIKTGRILEEKPFDFRITMLYKISKRIWELKNR